MFAPSETPPELSWQNLVLIVPIVLILIYSIWRRRKQGSTRLTVAIGLLSNINHNLKVADAYIKDWKVAKKFKTGNWNKHKEHMDFLDALTKTAVNNAFTMATDFNQQIDTAKKSKTISLLANLPMEKLKEPFAQGKKGIVEWVQANLQTELYSRRRGLFG